MFEVHTTLVLGAGASCGYNYPLGHDLVDKLISSCRGYTDMRNPSRGDYLKLKEALEFYDPVSIDSFLYHYEDKSRLILTAKRLISEVIIRSAQEERFKRPDPSSNKGDKELTNWYRFLWEALVSGQSAAELSDPEKPLNLNVVSFNYDASLERYFYTRVTSNVSMFTKDQQITFLKKISASIHHVYGCVMNYAWAGGDDDPDVYAPIGSDDLESMVSKAYTRIKLISERSQSNYQDIRECFSRSAQVIFLGFGFDDTNIGEKVLDLKKSLYRNSRDDSQEKLAEKHYPIIKFTNVGDSEVINKKVSILKNAAYHSDGGKQRVFKSTKPVYRAISEDFRINTI
ncbi:MAG: hypothetical protein Q7U82_12925 [Gammaproteobacteria bacterium]|nr:hypothetical protein [Gammaproteobacteria bacterium]